MSGTTGTPSPRKSERLAKKSGRRYLVAGVMVMLLLLTVMGLLVSFSSKTSIDKASGKLLQEQSGKFKVPKAKQLSRESLQQ